MLSEDMSSDDYKDEELVEDFSTYYSGEIRTLFADGFGFSCALT